MKAWIESVLALQSLDLKIHAYKVKMTALPAEKKNLDSQLKEAAAKLESIRGELRALEKQMKDFENCAEEINENIRKLLTQSIMVKKNNEYQAMMSDIEKKKAEVSDIETAEIELLDKIEEAKGKVKREEHEYAAYVKVYKSEVQGLAEAYKEVKEELKGVESLRAAHAAKFDEQTMAVYTRLLAKGNGQPMWAIMNGDSCSCCRLKLTTQTISNAKRGQLTLCDNCSHMLYYPEDPQN